MSFHQGEADVLCNWSLQVLILQEDKLVSGQDLYACSFHPWATIVENARDGTVGYVCHKALTFL